MTTPTTPATTHPIRSIRHPAGLDHLGVRIGVYAVVALFVGLTTASIAALASPDHVADLAAPAHCVEPVDGPVLDAPTAPESPCPDEPPEHAV